MDIILQANRAGFDTMNNNETDQNTGADPTAETGVNRGANRGANRGSGQMDQQGRHTSQTRWGLSWMRRCAIVLALLGLPMISAAIALLVTNGTDPGVGRMVLAGGAALLVMSAMVIGVEIRAAPVLRQRSKRRSIRLVTQHEDDVCVLTDSACNIVYANPSARRLWTMTATGQAGDDPVAPAGDTANGRALSAADKTAQMPMTLTDAWPDFGAVFDRLAGLARNGTTAADDFRINGRNSHLAVRRTSTGDLLWRLTEVGRSGVDLARLPMPLLTLGRNDTILFMNEAASTLIGSRPRHLTDILGDDPVAPGQLRDLATNAGNIPVALTELDSYRGRRDLLLLPVESPAVEPSLGAMPASLDATGLTGPGGASDATWDRFDNLPVPLLRLDLAGRVEMANQPALQLLGKLCRQGAELADLTEGLGRPIADWLAEVAAGRQSHGSEFLRVRGTDSETYVQMTLNLIEESGNRGLLAVLTDATELKTLEAQFVQSQKMQAIGQLAGGVAHDFNNLLTAITGHCDLLLLRHDQGDQDYADLMQINQNANRAASLVSQLLAFSRKQTLRPEEVDLREALSDLTHLLNRLVGEKVSLNLRHDPKLNSIRADKRQLEQVMMNLVVNARDAMEAGGNIQVITERLDLKDALTRDRATVPAGEYACIKVIDTGKGIPPEQLAKVFEPFYTTKRVGEGTGLGLSTAYGIVKQTGGFIFVDSKVGIGTTFTLLFPAYVAKATTQPAAPTPARIGPRHSDGVVLLVEDEAPVRAFASRALRLRGYTVHEAASAEEALEVLADTELKVDIFVTDVVMPGMDGPTWVRKALVDRPDVRVVFVSGYAEESFGDEQAKITNSVFLPKPFSLSELTETVQSQMT